MPFGHFTNSGNIIRHALEEWKMLKDSSPEKWVYKEHTRVKHELLRKYLSAWVIKLGKFHSKVIFRAVGMRPPGKVLEVQDGDVVERGDGVPVTP